MKPSERIKEILRAMKILDGQDPNSKDFESISFAEAAIMRYLDEKENGTGVEQRRAK